MKNTNKTKEQLLTEIGKLNEKITVLENQKTKYKQTEEKLQINKLDLQEAQRIGHLGFWDFNLVNGDLYWSDESFRIYGYEPNEFKPTFKKFQSIVYTEDFDFVQKNVDDALKNKKKYNIDFRFIRPDKEIGWIHCEGEVTCDKKGKPLRLFGTQLDITERKQAEEGLKESEEKYKTLVENNPDGLISFDLKGKVLNVNKAFEELTGFNREAIIGKHVTKLPTLIKQDLGFYTKTVKEVFSGKKFELIEFKWKNANGEIRDGEAKISSLKQAGKIIGMQVILRDITERKQAEEFIRTQAEIAKNITEGVYITGTQDLRIYWANSRFESMFGYEPGEMVGKHISMVNAPADIDPKETAKKIADILSNTGEWHGEVQNIKKDGTLFWCHANVSQFNHPTYGEVYLSVHTDITDRKEAEDELRDTLTQLRKLSSRLESIREEEAGRISRELHDEMGQYLTAINLNLQELSGKLEKGDKDSIDELLKRTSEIVNETEEKVHELSLELRPLMLEELGLVPTFRWYIDKTFSNLKTNCDFVNTNMKIRLNEDIKIAIFRVMQETITNVLRHAEANNIEINLERIDENLIYTISDDGKGFDVKKYGTITKPSDGLGLVGIKERIQRFGGKLTIETKPKRGTTVKVEMPLKDKDSI